MRLFNLVHTEVMFVPQSLRKGQRLLNLSPCHLVYVLIRNTESRMWSEQAKSLITAHLKRGFRLTQFGSMELQHNRTVWYESAPVSAVLLEFVF